MLDLVRYRATVPQSVNAAGQAHGSSVERLGSVALDVHDMFMPCIADLDIGSSTRLSIPDKGLVTTRHLGVTVRVI